MDPGNRLGSGTSWKRYRSEVPLEYGNEIVVEEDRGASPDAPRSLRARVTSVDNDALFSSKVTVEPIGEI